MDREAAKDYIIHQEPIFLERARDINGRHSYVCPCCNNGSGINGTGITMIPRTNDHPMYKCFKCGEASDVIGLARQYTGYDNIYEVFCYLYDEYGLTVDGCKSTNRHPVVRNSPVSRQMEEEKPEVCQLDYYKITEANLDASYLEGRGISLETQRHYHVGTDKQWINPVVKERFEKAGLSTKFIMSPRCIIPISKTAYLARDTREDIPESSQKFQKVKVGKVSLFAKADARKADILFVTEGEIDAMSVYEATKGECKASGLGSTSNWRKLVQFLQEEENSVTGVVLLLDNDDAGQKATEKLKEALDEMGMPHCTPGYEGKDPNESWLQHGGDFKEMLVQAKMELQMQLSEDYDKISER